MREKAQPSEKRHNLPPRWPAEDKGYKTITELEFDDGVWKVEVHQPDGKEVHIKVDPVSSAIR